MRKEYVIQLSQEQRQQLHQLISAGTAPARTLARARILLKADEGPEGPGWKDPKIAEALDHATVERTRRRCVLEGMEAALRNRPSRRVYGRKLDGRQEARLIALACSEPPPGQKRWSLRLLAEHLVVLEDLEGLSPETVRQTLKKMT
jgi:hypothetical protein